MYNLHVTFQTIKPISKLALKIKRLKKTKQFRNIKFPSIFKTYSKKKLFTVLKSPHVNKKAREQFIYKTYKQNMIFLIRNINQLINLMIFLKKKYSKNIILKFKIKLLKKKEY
jgi:ribosomal protein S10